MKIWYCKIGEVDESAVPPGGDAPMRDAVERAFLEVTGQDSQFTFSGWGGELDESERAVVEDREPDFNLTDYADKLLRAVAAFAQEHDATFGMSFTGRRGWLCSMTWGQEAPDSPMVGAASYGAGDTPFEALNQMARELRLKVVDV